MIQCLACIASLCTQRWSLPTLKGRTGGDWALHLRPGKIDPLSYHSHAGSLLRAQRLHFLPFFTNILLNKFVEGMIATLANHGVAQTLRINLAGSKAFVIAYAVANLRVR